MNDQTPPSTADLKGSHRLFYILRLWQAEGQRFSDWRASLESPVTGQRIGFASLELLFGYLINQCEYTVEPQDATDIEGGQLYG